MAEVILLTVLALMAFYYFNNRLRARREEKRERLREKREEYMENLLEKLRSEKEGRSERDNDQLK